MRARTGLLGRLDSLDTEKTTYMNTVHIIPRETSGGVKRKLWLDRLDTVKTTFKIISIHEATQLEIMRNYEIKNCTSYPQIPNFTGVVAEIFFVYR